MKKTIATVLVLATVFSLLAGIALAERAAWGSKMITCQPNTEIWLMEKSVQKTDSRYLKKLYVRHYLWGEWGGEYTNYFRATVTGYQHNPRYLDRTSCVGGKWMTPGGAYYVSSSTMTLNKWCAAWARGNTDYGVNRIEISGYYESNG